MKFFLTLLVIVSIMTEVKSYERLNDPKTDDLPYAEIPAYPEIYTPAAVAARMIDGLGFRYRYATENLRPEDLAYLPGNDGRSTDETLDHIYALSEVIVQVAQKKVIDRSGETPKLEYPEKRNQTLMNLKEASDLLKAGKDGGLETFTIKFKSDGEMTEYPFWNIINGMITDAIWHTGQIVSFRRSSGNPIRNGVNYFSGTVK